MYTCTGTHGAILDVVPHVVSGSFIKSFRRFVSRRGCPSVMIIHNGRNFVSNETVEFVSGLSVNWRLNMPLAPWHGGFVEMMARNTKTLLRKTLQTVKLTYEELQAVLCKVKQIINNRPITYYYSDNEESCLTPNHLLYGWTLKYNNLLSDSTTGELITPKKLDNLLSHFWERWRKEYLVNLRESHKTAKAATTKGEHPTVQIGDVVVIEEGNMLRSSWKLGKIEELVKGDDDQVRETHMKVAKINALIQRPVSRLYNIEDKEGKVNSDVLNKDNVNRDSYHSANTSNRPKKNPQ